MFESLIDQRAGALLNEVKAAYQLQALQRNVPATEPVVTADEKAAASLLVEQVPAASGAGGRVGGGGGGAPEAGAVEVMAVLRAREAAGTIKLVPKPAGK